MKRMNKEEREWVEEKEEMKEGVVEVKREREEKSIGSNSTSSSTYIWHSL